MDEKANIELYNLIFSLKYFDKRFLSYDIKSRRKGGGGCRKGNIILPFLQYREYFFSYTMDFEKSGAATKNDV